MGMSGQGMDWDRCDYAQAFLARLPAYRQGYAMLASSVSTNAKEDFARSWGLRFPFRSRQHAV
jgi:hypothetical protein